MPLGGPGGVENVAEFLLLVALGKFCLTFAALSHIQNSQSWWLKAVHPLVAHPFLGFDVLSRSGWKENGPLRVITLAVVP